MILLLFTGIALCSLSSAISTDFNPIVLTCPVEGQVFQQCPLPCSATCSDPNPICDVECTPRCACPVGQVIDTVNNKCVDPQQCPQNCTGILCASPNCGLGQIIVIRKGQCCPDCVAIDPCGSKTCPVGSRCRVNEPTGEAFCVASCDIDNGGCPKDQECSIPHVPCVKAPCSPEVKCTPRITTDCPIEGQVYQDCAPCVATCSRPFPICPSGKCTSGCACPAGQVVDTVNKRCISILRCSKNCALISIVCARPICAEGTMTIIPPGQCCPACVCRVGDKSYQVGDRFKLDCNDCTCAKTGQVICGTNKCDDYETILDH